MIIAYVFLYIRNTYAIIYIYRNTYAIWHLFGSLLAEIKKFFDEIIGVYFPKYVRDICLQLRICGWVKNSKTGTILGKMQGHRALVDQM